MNRHNFSLFNDFPNRGKGLTLPSSITTTYNGTNTPLNPIYFMPSTGTMAWYSSDFLGYNNVNGGISVIYDQAPSGGNQDISSSDSNTLANFTRSSEGPRNVNMMIFVSGSGGPSTSTGTRIDNGSNLIGAADQGFHIWCAFKITASAKTGAPLNINQDQAIFLDPQGMFLVFQTGANATTASMYVGFMSLSNGQVALNFNGIALNEYYVVEFWRNSTSKTLFSRYYNTTISSSVSSSVVTVLEQYQGGDGVFFGGGQVTNNPSFNGYVYDTVFCNLSQSNQVSKTMSGYFNQKLGTLVLT